MGTFSTLRLKVKPESYNWLNKAAREVNFVWNWANETSEKAIRRYAGKPVWLSGYDLDKLSSGSSVLFQQIGSDTINKVNSVFASRRKSAKKARLSWRRSAGSRKSLGWVPFAGNAVKRKGNAVRYASKTFRVFQSERLSEVKLRDGCFAQDACGDWWLCIPVEVVVTDTAAPIEAVGIDLGIKDTATTSDGLRLQAGQYFRKSEQAIAHAQRRGHRRQAKRLSRKVARQRKDTLHKFSRMIVNRYQKIVVGDVSSTKLVKTRMAKSVLDSGWGILKTQLQYKGQQAGRSVQVVNENYTSRTCSGCGCLSGPAGLGMLAVRHWTCVDCGESHDRDVNAARNILRRAEASVSVSGNESHRKRGDMDADTAIPDESMIAAAPGSAEGE